MRDLVEVTDPNVKAVVKPGSDVRIVVERMAGSDIALASSAGLQPKGDYVVVKAGKMIVGSVRREFVFEADNPGTYVVSIRVKMPTSPQPEDVDFELKVA